MNYMGKPLHKIYGTRLDTSQKKSQWLDTSRRGVVLCEAIDDYYSGSWVAISTITLNGDLARAAQGGNLGPRWPRWPRWTVVCAMLVLF